MKRLLVTEFIGRPWGVIGVDAINIRQTVSQALRAGDRVEVSFSGMEMVTGAFLSNSIGRLYGEFDAGWLQRYLLVTGLEDSGSGDLLHEVRLRANSYYSGMVESAMLA